MQDDCSMEIQKMFCSEILSLTRGTPVAGFLGVKMTIAYPGIPHNIFKVKYADHATVVYLEWQWAGEQLKPIHSKIKTIVMLSVQSSRRELQHFWGMEG